MNGYYDWQWMVYQAAATDGIRENIMVVAERGAGKTYLLDGIHEACGPLPYGDGASLPPATMREVYEEADDLVVVDHAEAIQRQDRFREFLAEYDHVQTVVSALPEASVVTNLGRQFTTVRPSSRRFGSW